MHFAQEQVECIILDADCSMQRFTSSPLQFSLVNKKKKATKKLQMSRRDNSAEIEEEGKKTEILTREKGRKNKERESGEKLLPLCSNDTGAGTVNQHTITNSCTWIR